MKRMLKYFTATTTKLRGIRKLILRVLEKYCWSNSDSHVMTKSALIFTA